MSPTSASNLSQSLRWVEDFGWYSQFKLPPLRKHRTRFTAEDITALEQAEKFVLCEASRLGPRRDRVAQRLARQP